MPSIATASSSASRAISEGGPAPRARAIRPAPLALLTLALLVPALANGFPLVFPDSGTYLGIATGADYAIDRSSVYGLLLKPFVTLLPGVPGLWLALAAQALAVAAVLLLANRALVAPSGSPSPATFPSSSAPFPSSPRRRGSIDTAQPDQPPHRRPWIPAFAGMTAVAFLPLLLPFTSLPWHAAQFMPDAFTGPLVLLACLAATRVPGTRGAPLLWLAALVLALTHYTHVVLLAAVASVAILAQVALGLRARAAAPRLAAALATAGLAAALLAAANGAVLGRFTMSPLGPVFLFARLNEDGLTGRWLDRHCGRDAPAPLCAERHLIARDSQALLWRDPNGPVARHVWQPPDDAERWRWVAMMAAANRGAIAERPLAFLASAARGTTRQFLAFAALDDECPANCGRDIRAGVAFVLARDRPTALAPLRRSMQLRDTTPKALVRAVTTPVAALALLLLPVLLVVAWRRRDPPAFAFACGIATALAVNAALAGALSDVHDRYQSRVVWLAPFLLVCLALRWRRPACPPAAAGA